VERDIPHVDMVAAEGYLPQGTRSLATVAKVHAMSLVARQNLAIPPQRVVRRADQTQRLTLVARARTRKRNRSFGHRTSAVSGWHLCARQPSVVSGRPESVQRWISLPSIFNVRTVG
jgi:hypothetical protein